MNIEKGTILDGTYEVIGQIGAGGGGIVYRARHLRLQTDVVIKKIKEEVREKVKLRQEVDILKELKHPYLPRVYDFIETEDGVYTIMDFIEGEDLDTALKRHGKYDSIQVKKWAEQLGDVLAYLHSREPAIIHSDIKPANIMLTKSGDICLIDFNISLAAGAKAESAVGISAGFSPPEQYRDPALYARVTHNYTLQKLSESIKKSTYKATPDEEKTVLLNEMSDEDKTVLLKGLSDEDKTVLLKGLSDEEKTVLLEGLSDEDKTVLLENLSDEDKTVLLKDLSVSNERQDTAARGTENVQPVTTNSKSLPAYTHYMGRGIDTRSDIYSLGITLYYLVTGIEPPADFEKRIPVLETDIKISEGFAIILEKMMELRQEDRFQNGMEFYKAVKDCHKLDRRYIQMKRRQMLMQAAALFCLFVGVLLIFGGMNVRRKEENIRYVEIITKAQECIKENNPAEAQVWLEQARELDSTRISAYKEQIYLLYQQNKTEECVQLGNQYIEGSPFVLQKDTDNEELGDIYYIIGNAYYDLADYENAANYLKEAISLNKKNGLYYRDCAIAFARLGMLEEAEEYLEDGMEIGISEDSIYMVEGELAFVQGQVLEAAESLEKAILLTQDETLRKRAILLAVDAYKAMGQEGIDQEIALLEQYQDKSQSNANLIFMESLADAYARKAQSAVENAAEYYGKALELFKQVLDKGYRTYQLQENIAILYENMGDFTAAEELLLSMVDEYPMRYEVYMRLAYLEADKQQKKGNVDREYFTMQSYYEKAVELYEQKEQDTQMQMLDNLMRELRDGGWL